MNEFENQEVYETEVVEESTDTLDSYYEADGEGEGLSTLAKTAIGGLGLAVLGGIAYTVKKVKDGKKAKEEKSDKPKTKKKFKIGWVDVPVEESTEVVNSDENTTEE